MNSSGEPPIRQKATSQPATGGPNNPRRAFVILVAAIFSIELLIMVVFLFAPPLSPVLESLLDAVSLTVLVAPVLYRFAILPLYRQIAILEEATKAQERLNEMLESRVQERTSTLERQAGQLQAVSSVARTIASVQDLDTLLPEITKLVSEQFGYYHVGIFLVDEAGQAAVLRAANSEGGRVMLNRRHQLPLDGNSIVGFAASRGEPRIALDVGTASVYFNNPDLPGTRSEMALPLRIGTRVIGALDVQSDQTNAFTQEDIEVLATLADQVAIAIENARLFGESQNALSEARRAFDKYVEREWSSFTRQVRHSGFMFDGKQVFPLSQDGKREPVGRTTGSLSFDRTSPSIAIPIRLRGQTIGVLDVRNKKGPRAWTQDEITLLEAAAERAALALENARLVESAQRRASRERAIGEISSRIGAFSDMEAILQSAVEELGRKIGGATEVTIELGEAEAGHA